MIEVDSNLGVQKKDLILKQNDSWWGIGYELYRSEGVEMQYLVKGHSHNTPFDIENQVVII